MLDWAVEQSQLAFRTKDRSVWLERQVDFLVGTMAKEISCSMHPGVGGRGQNRTVSIAMFSTLQLDHLRKIQVISAWMLCSLSGPHDRAISTRAGEP